MFKRLTNFNLLYGAALMVLSSSLTDDKLWTVVPIAIILLFNWLTLKQIHGIKAISIKSLNALRILTLVIAFLILSNYVILVRDIRREEVDIGKIAMLISIRLIFVFTVVVHVFLSYRLSYKSK